LAFSRNLNLFTGGGRSDEVQGTTPGVTRWEYPVEIRPRQERPDINPYGLQGWELVSVISNPFDAQSVFYFKRPLDRKPTQPGGRPP
jgi:hypothetical protein